MRLIVYSTHSQIKNFTTKFLQHALIPIYDKKQENSISQLCVSKSHTLHLRNRYFNILLHVLSSLLNKINLKGVIYF